jgi:23S rRNA (cytosine1962-C5)-methyltransferase
MDPPSITLRPGRERSVARHHPWIFSGSIASVEGDPGPGETVLVRDANRAPLGWASYHEASNLRARLWTTDPDQRVDAGFVAARVQAAAARRDHLVRGTDALRLVFSEADGVPGVVADRYADTVVVQLTTAGADRWRPVIVETLAALPGVARVHERSDADARRREGLEERTGTVHGAETPSEIIVTEGPWRFAVDVTAGHKTGFYLDQRPARVALAALSPGRSVLNAFGYTGAFTVVAAASGATSVTTIDSSAPALALARRNAELNGVAAGELVQADAFAELRRLRDRRASFDLIILDPPKLAHTPAQLDKASRAYKDLNLLAAKLLKPGGILMTFSCSGAMTAELFRKVVAGAALDAGRELRVVDRLGQPADHPVPLHFPEAEYLTGLVLVAD